MEARRKTARNRIEDNEVGFPLEPLLVVCFTIKSLTMVENLFSWFLEEIFGNPENFPI
jgi:hypothetical protein